jgi:hypothetical protein
MNSIKHKIDSLPFFFSFVFLNKKEKTESFGFVGSSETGRGVSFISNRSESSSLCEATSSLISFKNNTISLDPIFIQWFVGFAEGDGGFYKTDLAAASLCCAKQNPCKAWG